MTEYISRDSALAFQCEVEPVMCKSVTTGKVFSATPDTALVKFLNALPAADVAPVRRGRWIDDYESGWSDCSVCGANYLWEDFKGIAEWNYCPKCGAKMEGQP